MKPNLQLRDAFELFQAHFDQLLDPSHELIQLARWVKNPYWQYFCYTFMQHECPIHPASMTNWRNRVGAKRLEKLITQTIDLAVQEKHLPT